MNQILISILIVLGCACIVAAFMALDETTVHRRMKPKQTLPAWWSFSKAKANESSRTGG